jgi:hypothetical protein
VPVGQREYERRRAGREDDVRRRRPRHRRQAHKGKIEVRRPFFGDPQLVIAGRNKMKLVDALERQLEAVRSVLGTIAPDVPVVACFCFVNPAGQAGGSGIPLVRKLSIRGHPLLYPRRLAKLLNEPGELGHEQIHSLAEALARQFPLA